MQQAVEQRHVRAGLQRQIDISDFGGVGAARVADDDFQRRIGRLRVFNAPEQNGVRKRRVAAGDEQALGVFQVVVAGGRRIGPQRLFVARDGAAHAQARVGVDVVGADQALGQLVEDVIVFGQQLAGNVKTHRVRAVVLNDAGEFFGGEIQRAVPADAPGRRLAGVALHGVKQPGLLRDGGGGRQVQRRAFGAEPPEVGRVRRVAAHAGDLAALRFDDHAAADAAVRAG